MTETSQLMYFVQHLQHKYLQTVECRELVKKYSRTSVARTHLGPSKLVRDGGSSSQRGLIICQVRRLSRDIFFIFFNLKVFCVFSLESPH